MNMMRVMKTRVIETIIRIKPTRCYKCKSESLVSKLHLGDFGTVPLPLGYGKRCNDVQVLHFISFDHKLNFDGKNKTTEMRYTMRKVSKELHFLI